MPGDSTVANMSEPAAKAVLVSLHERNRVVYFSGSKRGDLLPAVETAFADLLGNSENWVLQLKDDNWGGVFIDLQDQDIPERSVLRIVLLEASSEVPQQVGINQCAMLS